MRNIVFVAPYFAETTIRFIGAVAGLPGVRTALVSQDPLDRLPGAVRSRLSAHQRIERGLDPEQITHAVQALSERMGSVDVLLGTLEELQVPLGEVRDRLGIAGMGAETARNFRDKSRMKKVLRSAGLPCARHVLATNPEQAIVFAKDQGFPLIVKPPAGSGARSTFRVENEDELKACLATLGPSSERPALVEEFVVGDEHSFDSVSLAGQVVWHSINHYLPSPLEVLREPWIQWCVLLPREVDDPRYDEIRSVAQRALTALGMDTGLSHMEWFRRLDGSVAISEVGARPPGARFVNLMSQAHDTDMFQAWARAVALGEFEPRPRPYAAGAVYLRAQGRGRTVTGVRGVKEIVDALGPTLVEAHLPRSGQPRGSTYEGEGYLIVRHPETEVVRKALATILKTVRIDVDDPGSSAGAPHGTPPGATP